MFDFLNGMGGGLTSILPTFGGLTQGAVIYLVVFLEIALWKNLKLL